jgi:hypothetical protein
MRPVRRLRHWKQRFQKDADFIWNKAVMWQGTQVKIGDKIPDILSNNTNKVRRFWEAGVISLMDFSEPDVLTGQVPVDPADVVVTGDLIKHSDRSWAVEGFDETYTSKKKAQAAVDDWMDAAQDEAEALNEPVPEEDGWLDGEDEPDNPEESDTEEAGEAETDTKD